MARLIWPARSTNLGSVIPASDAAAIRRALAEWALDEATVEPFGAGLINRTYRVSVPGRALVLQRVNAIFDPAIHDNIRAVTERLVERGIPTPRLVETTNGHLYVDAEGGGVFRVMTLVPGVGFDTVRTPAQARSAGALVARFHAALEGLPHRFSGLRLGVHDTPRHLQTLRDALAEAATHRLRAEVVPLGEAILAAVAKLPVLPVTPPRIGHGDLKFNNLLFSAAAPDDAYCLVDLDTVAPLPLAHELGDAWRSWCNPRGEDREDGVFDLETFAASLDGYLGTRADRLSSDERKGLLHGVEWISVELAARFCADAIRERYFGWDATRFPGRGEHNLVRAKSQLALHRAALATRDRRASLLGLGLGRA